MAKVFVIIFLIANIYILLGESQGIIYGVLGESLISELRESSGTGGSSSHQMGTGRDWDREDYGEYRESSEQKQQSQRSGSSEGVYLMQEDNRRGDSRGNSGSSWDSKHRRWE